MASVQVAGCSFSGLELTQYSVRLSVSVDFGTTVMSAFRPKSKGKTKSKYSNGLPQFYSYKDKTISNTYSEPKFLRAIRNFFHTYKKMLYIAGAIYFVFAWLLSPLFSLSDNTSAYNPKLWSDRKLEVKKAFLDSWHDYVKHGWGTDVYSPVKQSGKNIGKEPLGWIIVDSLDTMMLMDCKDELEDAKAWVDAELNYDIASDVNVFETTIRMLGGLLSAHYLSNDDDTTYLEKAVTLGNRLVTAFDTKTGIPVMELNLHRQSPGIHGFPSLGASTAEIATLQLEFKYLANLTGEAYFWDSVEKVMAILDSNQFSSPGVYNPEYDGLVPVYVNQHTGKFNKKLIRLGSRGDSYYEYLLKQYLQTGEKIYFDMYKHAYDGIKKHLVKESYPNNLVFIGELPKGIGGNFDAKMDHLVCFAGGMFALGATEGLTELDAMKQPWWDTFRQDQLNLGKEVAKTCYHMYHDTPGTGLSPEIVVFNQDASKSPANSVLSNGGDFYIKPNDKHNLQRPETVETLYILYKITGDIKYREWGWEIFENFIDHTKITDGDGKTRYTSLRDCTVNPSVKADNMESFWLAETLKYLYLLFDDETGSSKNGVLTNGKLDKWDLKNMVFNTEAHPLPKFAKNKFGKEWLRGVSPLENTQPASAETESTKEDEMMANRSKNNKANINRGKINNDNLAKKAEAIREMRLDDEVQQEFNSEFIENENEINDKNVQGENGADNIVNDIHGGIGGGIGGGISDDEGNGIGGGLGGGIGGKIGGKIGHINSQGENENSYDVDLETGKAVELELETDDVPAVMSNHKKVLNKQILESNSDAGNNNLENSDDTAASVAELMKANGEKPIAKQPVAKSLNEQVEEANQELNSNIKGESMDNHGLSKEIADEMKAHGEKPVAKQAVAKPLNEQAIEAQIEFLKEVEKEENIKEGELV